MDEELRQRIEERARRLWEQDGRPESGLNAYLAQAEDELVGHSTTGDEDPLEALDHEPPGAGQTKPGG
jgi:hypothetical protein